MVSKDRGRAGVNGNVSGYDDNWLAPCQGKIYKKKPSSARSEALHLKFEKTIKLEFGIFEKVYAWPEI